MNCKYRTYRVGAPGLPHLGIWESNNLSGHHI